MVDSDWVLVCIVTCHRWAGTQSMEELVYIPGRLVHVCHKAGIHSDGLANQARVETIKIHLHYECFNLF